MSATDNRLDSLQFVRAFAAIWVLITHVFQKLEIKPFGYFFSGQYGVDVFFILSGFLIYLTTKDTSNWTCFAIKRLFRIYPAYLLCFVTYLIYDVVCTSTVNCSIWQNVLMFPCSDKIGYRSLLVAQAWSTCFELYFYTVFGLLLLLKIPKKHIIWFLFGLFAIGMILNICEANRFGFGRYCVSLLSSIHIYKFCLGIAFAMFYDKIKNIKLKGGTVWILWGGYRLQH